MGSKNLVRASAGVGRVLRLALACSLVLRRSSALISPLALPRVRAGWNGGAPQGFPQALFSRGQRWRCDIPGSARARGSAASAADHDTRHFVVLCHNVTDAMILGDFNINNLLENRVDVMCRCVSAGLWVSNGIRRNAHVWLMLGESRLSIEVLGSDVSGLNPDEKTVALMLQRTLADHAGADRVLQHLIQKDNQNRDVAAGSHGGSMVEVGSMTKIDEEGEEVGDAEGDAAREEAGKGAGGPDTMPGQVGRPVCGIIQKSGRNEARVQARTQAR